MGSSLRKVLHRRTEPQTTGEQGHDQANELKALSVPDPALLFIAVLGKKDSYNSCRTALINRFGVILREKPPESFSHTTYYQNEMGMDLVKGILVFRDPVPQHRLIQTKMICRELEWNYGESKRGEFKRIINLDPGLIMLEKIVLSTSKNFSHRLYLGQGIFGEVTLIYHKTGWEELPWTYPDYKDASIKQMLLSCRNHLYMRIQPGSTAVSG